MENLVRTPGVDEAGDGGGADGEVGEVGAEHVEALVGDTCKTGHEHSNQAADGESEWQSHADKSSETHRCCDSSIKKKGMYAGVTSINEGRLRGCRYLIRGPTSDLSEDLSGEREKVVDDDGGDNGEGF